MVRRSVAWLFRNRRTGQLTIAQFPNAPLWIFILCVVADRVLPGTSTAHRILAWLGVAALAWWAADEVIRGVNPWRRFLGLAGVALVVAQVARLAR
ncbi:MAG TPA: hypothetical protein VIJ09_07735 [Acidimicrobiales bacterium]